MKVSQLFGLQSRKKTADTVQKLSKHTDLLLRGGFINKHIAGVYTYLPLGLRVVQKIEDIIREEINAIGGQEIKMPSLHSANVWKQTGRWDSVDVLFKFTSYFSKTPFVIAPTHEEVVTPLAKEYVLSYKDLPLYLYQIQSKFRDEKRPTLGLTRLIEFRMKDLYSFHTDKKDLDEYYETAKTAYLNIFERLGLKDLTYITMASGGDFTTEYSHEFQVVAENGQDRIYNCAKCGSTYNKEVLSESKQNICPECKGELKEMRGLEVGNIFKLGTKYSKLFNFEFTAKNGSKKTPEMGCYGIGIDRALSAIAETLSDEHGLVWPVSVCPYQVHIVSLENEKNVSEESRKQYEELTKQGLEVLWDDREDVSAGTKFNDADLIGVPLRVIISKRTLSDASAEVKNRKEHARDGSLVKLDSLADYLHAQAKLQK